MHVFVIFDEIQSESSLKSIQNGINRYMQRRILEVDGVKVEKTLCDPAASTYNQPLYISPPVLKDGIKAPFYFRDRRHFIIGESQFISTDDLLCEIDEDDALYAPVKATRAEKVISSETARKKIRESAPAIFSDPSIIDLAFERSQRKPIKLKNFIEQNPNGWSGDILPYRKQCTDLNRCNILDDSIKLIQASGKLSGERKVNDTLTILLSLAVKKLPLEEITEERVVAITEHIARLVFEDNDTVQEKLEDWISARKYSSILRRALDAASGNTIHWGGRDNNDRRYEYTQARVRREMIMILGDGAESLIRELGLTTLFTDSDKKDKRRRDNGVATRDEFRSSCLGYRLEREIVTMSDQGIPNREIARLLCDYWQVDISEITVRRTLNRVRHMRPSTVLYEGDRAQNQPLNDVDDSLTSSPEEYEIVNITKNTDIIQNNVCDLSVFDSLLPEVKTDAIIDLKSKCDSRHLDVIDVNEYYKMKNSGLMIADIERVIDNIDPVIVHNSFGSDIKPIISKPSTRTEIDAAALLEPRYVHDTSFTWSVRAMQRMQSLGIPWVEASDAVKRLWNFSVQPPILILKSEQSLAA